MAIPSGPPPLIKADTATVTFVSTPTARVNYGPYSPVAGTHGCRKRAPGPPTAPVGVFAGPPIAAAPMSTPIRRTRSPCVLAASGHASRRAAESSDEIAPSKANAHLAILSPVVF